MILRQPCFASSKESAAEAVCCRSSVRSSVHCPSVNSDEISLYLADFDKLGNTDRVSGHCRKSFQGQRSKIKVMCVEMCECFSGGGMHLDGVASSLAYYPLSPFYVLEEETNDSVFQHKSFNHSI